MAAADSTAAFLPFLKKRPAVAVSKNEDEDDDPLALPIPPPPKLLSSTNSKTSKFVSKLNTGKAKSSSGHVPAAAGRAANGRAVAEAVARAVGSQTAVKVAKKAAAQSPAAAQQKPNADAKRLRQLERMAKLGALATGDAPVELRSKVEQAKKTAEAIRKQQEEEYLRKAVLERQRHQHQAEIAKRQQLQDALQERLQAEKQLARDAKLRALHAKGAISASSVAGPAANSQHKPGIPKQPRAATVQHSQASLPRSSQQDVPAQMPRRERIEFKDPYAHLPPKQRAFLLARRREREGLGPGRSSPGARGRGRQEGYESDDSLDSFIDDNEDVDWRAELRSLTRYDPSKYRDNAADDRAMEASAADIAREEARSKRIAKTEDEREAEAEARRQAAKEDKRARKRNGAGAFFDD